jgi:predicted transcriptional regulator
MEEEFITLQTIFDIVKNDSNPKTYLCSAREIILRQLCGWNIIQDHLQLLAEKEMVVVKQLDKIFVSITEKGIEYVNSATPVAETAFIYADKMDN